MSRLSDNKRTYGEHLTPIQVFKEHILPDIKEIVHDYIWVDLFAGEGNLILPILELLPESQRVSFFQKHMFLFDIQEKQVERAIANASNYGIPRNVAEKNIFQYDTIRSYPNSLLNLRLPLFHITNPPYLYIGYIVKHKETQKYLEYFTGENSGYQDLYQLALMNDLRSNLERMIYIIPSNFLFGSSVSNKIRTDFLKYYQIRKAIIFEQRIFEFTGTNVMICFFEKKQKPEHGIISFYGIKINNGIKTRNYVLDSKNQYRAGNEYDVFVSSFRSLTPLKIKHYLTMDEVEMNSGEYEVEVIDSNAFDGKEYAKIRIHVNRELYDNIMSNGLFIRTVDTGSPKGRAGLYLIRDVFNADGILVTKAKYRTHPIQIFIKPKLTTEHQSILKDYFNIILEHFRRVTDSEFMTTYKYSNSEYTRKYFGLLQARKLIETFPLHDLNQDEQIIMYRLIKKADAEELIEFVKYKNGVKGIDHWL